MRRLRDLMARFRDHWRFFMAPSQPSVAERTREYYIGYEDGYAKGRTDALREVEAKRSAAGKRAWETRRTKADA